MNYPSIPANLGNLPYPANTDIQFFPYSNGTNWFNWYKPTGASMIHIICVSGGGGGGGANIAAAGNNRSGGGGGASGGLASLTLPAFLLPDILYVLPGAEGAGGAGAATNGVNGGSGGTSYVSLGHSTAAPNVLLASNGGTVPGGGTGGNSGAGGTGGTAPTVATIGVFAQLGFFQAVLGIAGTAGGLRDAAGTNLTNVWNTLPLGSGTGGGGSSTTSQNGGSITLGAAADFNFVNFPTAIAAGGAGGGSPGNNGVSLWQPFFQTGGSGGGSINTAAGGNGGKGGYGCGGGGGASGTAGGSAGDGGNGFVLIISW